MRRIFAVAVFIAIVSAAATVVTLGDASAQAPAIGVAPTPAYQIAAPPAVAPPRVVPAYTAYVLRQPGEAGEEQNNELARLQGDDARLAQEVESLSSNSATSPMRSSAATSRANCKRRWESNSTRNSKCASWKWRRSRPS